MSRSLPGHPQASGAPREVARLVRKQNSRPLANAPSKKSKVLVQIEC